MLVASALIDDPWLIVADEPTPGLDMELAVRALGDLRAFADAGGTVLLITHDLELALSVGGSRGGLSRWARCGGGTGVELRTAGAVESPLLASALARDA